MILYHFTSRSHLPSIMADGYLKLTESNVSPRRAHAGPDVVWLTTDPDGNGHGLDLGLNAMTSIEGASKTDIRFTVDVDKRAVYKWRDWAKRLGMSSDWTAQLAMAGGAGTWRVVERPIPASQWTEVRDTGIGADLLADYLRTTGELS